MTIDNMTIEELVNYLNKQRSDYYKGFPTISDEEFDFVERRLKERDPENEYFTQVGAKTLTRDIAIEHSVPMISMQKVQTVEDAEKWYEDIYDKFDLKNISDPPEVCVDPKLDGISGKLVYDSDGNFKFAATRGDGVIGALLPFADKLERVPKKFIPNSELRGEFIIPKKYQKYFDGPLRNRCTGLLKRKEYSEDCKYIDFVIYNYVPYDSSKEIDFKDRLDFINKIDNKLKEYGNKNYSIVKIFKTSNIDETYEEYVNVFRNKWEWETDGIILTVDGSKENYEIINKNYKITAFNRYNMAIKPPAICAETIVEAITAHTNRTKVSFIATVEPTQLMDIICTHATLDSYSLMMEKHIGIGSKVLIKRANDVIPKIIEATNTSSPNVIMPDFSKCPSCGQPLIRFNRDLICINEYKCPGIISSKIVHLFNCTNTKNVGPAIADKITNVMLERNETTWHDFFKTCIENGYANDIGMPINTKSGQNFKDSIDYMLHNITQLQFLKGLSIPSIGRRVLINKGILTIDGLIEYYKKLKKSNSIGISAIDAVIYKWCEDDKHLKDLKQCNVLLRHYFIEDVAENSNNGDSITYCISGEVMPYNSKKEIVEILESNPALTYTNTLTKETNYLITDNPNTGKGKKAEKYNIPIVTVDYLLNLK